MSLTSEMQALSPTKFEELVYDLCTLRGLRNGTWRTPGADGGRDIEGVVAVEDFSGVIDFQRWYVECKRYSAAIDWPTIYGKLAYASNHGAHYLLLCTTSHLSPTCKDEVVTHNKKGVTPFIRAWDGSHLATLVSSLPLILTKYRLNGVTRPAEASLSVLSQAIQRLVSSAYGAAVFSGSDNKSLEFAAAVADLIADLRSSSGMDAPRKFNAQFDSYPWMDVDGSVAQRLNLFPRTPIRAILCFCRRLERSSDRLLVANHHVSETISIGTAIRDGSASSSLGRELAVWGNLMMLQENGRILLGVRHA